MKPLIKRIVTRAVRNRIVFPFLDSTILRFSRFAERQRQYRTLERHAEIAEGDVLRTLFPDLAVRHGVFKGMKYPEAKSTGSTLFPKLLGSYERELHPLLDRLCGTAYTDIVDIGCAEGYYAVGLARRLPTTRVFAYDTDAVAIDLCRRMAVLNGVSSRVTTGAFCSADTLRSLALGPRCLIISDAEGYETELFSEEIVPIFAPHDLLIEVHDFININISTVIRQRFEKTHQIEVVESIDDIKKAQTYEYEELAPYDLQSRRNILAEGRPAIMEWFYMTPRARPS